MYLAIDIGNSNIVLAIYKEGSWTQTFRYESKDNQPQIYYEKGIRDVLMEWSIQVHDIKNIGISSVVPDLNDRIYHACQNSLGLTPKIITPDILMGLDMYIAKPYEIGSDLAANAYAAIKKYNTNAIVVDFGTALTFTAVHLEKGILGVTIAPGLKMAIHSLAGNTAQLPIVPLEMPTSAIGNSTAHAIQAGVIIGYRGLIKELIHAIKKEMACSECKIIATGGLSHYLEIIQHEVDIIDRELTLDGIRLILDKGE